MKNSFYADLVEKLTGTPFAGDEEATFPIGEDLSLTMALEEGEMIGLYCRVFQVEGEVPGWVMQEISLANYGCAGTRGATLGLHPGTGGVLLSRILVFAATASAEALMAQTVIFIETAALWQRRLMRRSGEGWDQANQASQSRPIAHDRFSSLRA